MERQIQVILLFLILSFFAKAQILTENFNWYIPRTTYGLALWVQDSLALNHIGGGVDSLTDLIAAYNLTQNGTVTQTSGSPISNGGTHLVPGGTTDGFTNTSGDFNVGTSDFTVQIMIKTPASWPEQMYIYGDHNNSDKGWFLRSQTLPTFDCGIFDGDLKRQDSTIANSTFYYLVGIFDRSGNMSFYSIGGDNSYELKTRDISSQSATSLTVIQSMHIAQNSGATSSNEWRGGVVWAKFTMSVLTDKQWTEDAFLAEGWTATFGYVGRLNFGFAQGIRASNTTLYVSVGSESSTVTMNATSTRDTLDFSTITSLSSTQLKFGTNLDTISYTLPDSVYAANKGTRVIFNSLKGTTNIWGEDYAILDSIVVTTYSTATAGAATATDGKFKQYSKHSKFKGF